jgi:hypothetical protein
MGVNLKEQAKREAEVRRQLEKMPLPADSDDEDVAKPSASSSTVVASAGSEILDKAGDFFNNFKTPIAMFASDLSSQPVPANRISVVAVSSSAQLSQPQNSSQTTVQGSLEPPAPVVAPGLQDYQRRSLRATAASEMKSLEKVARPLTFTPAPRPLGAKPDFLTPPPPQAPQSTSAASAPPADPSLLSSVEYSPHSSSQHHPFTQLLCLYRSVMSKLGSPFSSMFSPAAQASTDVLHNSKHNDADPAASSGGGIMESVSSSFGSLFTNAPDRLFSSICA